MNNNKEKCIMKHKNDFFKRYTEIVRRCVIHKILVPKK